MRQKKKNSAKNEKLLSVKKTDVNRFKGHSPAASLTDLLLHEETLQEEIYCSFLMETREIQKFSFSHIFYRIIIYRW